MARKKYAVEVRGNEKLWSFNVWAEDSWVEDWRADGLTVEEVVASVPEWLPAFLVPVWFFIHAVFHLKNPFKG